MHLSFCSKNVCKCARASSEFVTSFQWTGRLRVHNFECKLFLGKHTWSYPCSHTGSQQLCAQYKPGPPSCHWGSKQRHDQQAGAGLWWVDLVRDLLVAVGFGSRHKNSLFGQPMVTWWESSCESVKPFFWQVSVGKGFFNTLPIWLRLLKFVLRLLANSRKSSREFILFCVSLQNLQQP